MIKSGRELLKISKIEALLSDIECQIDALKKAMIEDQVEDLPGGEYSESTNFTI